MNKPTLVGETNPYGGDADYALYPAPDGCAGHRLCCMILGMRRNHYLEAFDRVNLLVGKWSRRAAIESARAMWAKPTRWILLGSKVCAAFQTPFKPFDVSEGGTILVLPHPSGRNLMWNEPGIIERTRLAVKSFCPELADFIGETDAAEKQTA